MKASIPAESYPWGLIWAGLRAFSCWTRGRSIPLAAIVFVVGGVAPARSAPPEPAPPNANSNACPDASGGSPEEDTAEVAHSHHDGDHIAVFIGGLTAAAGDHGSSLALGLPYGRHFNERGGCEVFVGQHVRGGLMMILMTFSPLAGWISMAGADMEFVILKMEFATPKMESTLPKDAPRESHDVLAFGTSDTSAFGPRGRSADGCHRTMGGVNVTCGLELGIGFIRSDTSTAEKM